MKFISTIRKVSKGSDSDSSRNEAVIECAKEITEGLDGATPDLVVCFVSSDWSSEPAQLSESIGRALKPGAFVGCTAGGVIGGGIESERSPALSITAALLPGVEVRAHHLISSDLPDPDAGPDSWTSLLDIEACENPSFILLPEPFSFTTSMLVDGLDYAYPFSVKVGGLASGGRTPGENRLFVDDCIYDQGIAIISLTGDLVIDTVVAQGCRPIGSPMTVTRSNRNILYELDGKPAVLALKDMLEVLSEREKSLLKDALFLGLVMDEMKSEHSAGDFLIRNILGIEPDSGALVVGEVINNARTVQFHVRDASSSADDLRILLKRYRDETLCKESAKASGALMFSCVGRGEDLYGVPNHDSDCFKSYLGAVPLGGFFCHGEIGPIGQNTFLHGYTSSFGIFRSKAPAE